MKTTHSVLVLLIVVSCNSIDKEFAIEIKASNPNLVLDNGVLLYNDVPFNGNLVTHFSNGKLKSDIQYENGRKYGFEKHWFANGDLSIERYYTKGVKTGNHKGWWENRNPKFVYLFNKKGAYNGNIREWYARGQFVKDFNYIDGQEVGSQRLWKPDGKIKANYEVLNGERFGLIGLKKCYTITLNSNKIK